MEGAVSALFRQDKLVVAGDPEPVFLLVMDQDDLPPGVEKRARLDAGDRWPLFAVAKGLSYRIHRSLLTKWCA